MFSHLNIELARSCKVQKCRIIRLTMNESYVDPSELPLGDYKSVLTVSYPGANNTVSGIISVKKYYSPYLYYAIIGAVLLIVLVIVVLWLVLRRRKSSREKN